MYFVKLLVVNKVLHPYVRRIRYGSLLYGLVADVNAFACTSVSFLRYARVGHIEHVNDKVVIQSILVEDIDFSKYGKFVNFSSTETTSSFSLIGTSRAGYVGVADDDHLLDVRFALDCHYRDDVGAIIYPHQFRGVLRSSDFQRNGRPWFVNVFPFATYLSRITSAASTSGFNAYWSVSSQSRHVFPRFKNGTLSLVPVKDLTVRNGFTFSVTSRNLTSFSLVK
jgi:hypothetical protein